MARTIGIGFAIGATLSSSVAKAFGAVGNSIEKTRAAMAAATKQQRVMSRAMELQSKRDALASQLKANPGDARLTRALTQVSRQYREAMASAREYCGYRILCRRRLQSVRSSTEGPWARP